MIGQKMEQVHNAENTNLKDGFIGGRSTGSRD
jgi:hypothetical protein